MLVFNWTKKSAYEGATKENIKKIKQIDRSPKAYIMDR